MAQQLAAAQDMPRSIWRFFPFFLVGALGVVAWIFRTGYRLKA
jgi:hypothetical protein